MKKENKKSVWKVKEHIYKWLIRIGVHEGDINITSSQDNKERAIVGYTFKGENYTLSTEKKRIYRDNLHNVELLIHSRVLGIERGIETLEQAFAGYKTLPDYSNKGYFGDCQDKEEASKLFKQLSKDLHPDTGGDIEQFKRMKEEFDNFS